MDRTSRYVGLRLGPTVHDSYCCTPGPRRGSGYAERDGFRYGSRDGHHLGQCSHWGAISFELARKFGRPLAQRMVSKHILAQTDRIANSAGWPGLLVLRLIPVIPFTAVNWGLGFTMLHRLTYFWTTALGLLPGAIVFTSTGSGLGALYLRYPALFPVVVVLAALAIGWTTYRFRLGWTNAGWLSRVMALLGDFLNAYPLWD